jgi:hypothetical protein
MEANLAGPVITTIGLFCDMIGAVLVAIEVVKVFREPTTIDIGGSGTIAGGFMPAVNPEYVKHEKEKHWFMKCGLGFLLFGFMVQGFGAWWPILTAH